MNEKYSGLITTLSRVYARERYLYQALQIEEDQQKKASLREQHRSADELLSGTIEVLREAGIPISRAELKKGLVNFLRELGVTPAKAAAMGTVKVEVASTSATRRSSNPLDQVRRMVPPVVPQPVVAQDAPLVTYIDLEDDEGEIDQNRVLEDFRYFCRRVLEIPYRPGMLASHPMGGEGPFLLTDMQEKLIAVIYEELLIQQRPLRLVILKSRQLGCTTLILAVWLWLCLSFKNFRVLFIIDKNKHNKTKRHQMLQWCAQVEKKCPNLPKISSKDEHFIIWDNSSMFMFESAEAPNPGTSEMLRGLQKSESPKWPEGRAQQVRESVQPGIPRAPLTMIVDESTAEGQGDFYNTWMRAEAGKGGEDAVIPIFFPWMLSHEYQSKPPRSCYDVDYNFIYENEDKELHDQDDGLDRFLNEQEYSEKYSLTPEQTYWRRLKIKVDFEGNTGSFNQEYPTTAAHAFRKVGTGYFSKHALDKSLLGSVRDPIWKGELICSGLISVHVPVTYTHVKNIQFAPSVQGELWVWEKPVLGEEYVLGGDVAEGLTVITETGEADPDYTVYVVKNKHGRTVARYKSHIKPEDSWPILLMLAMWYNLAFVNVETNGPGATLRSYFYQTGYPNNLVWPTPVGRSAKERMWTEIRAANRKSCLSQLRASYTADFRRMVSPSLLDEARHFISDAKTGKPKAASGHHDDEIMAECHAELARLFKLGLLDAAELEQAAQEPVVEVVSEVQDGTFVTAQILLQLGQRGPSPHTNKGWGRDFW